VPDGFKLRNAAKIAGKVIGLPIRPEMTEGEIDKVLGAVHTIKKRRGILPAGLMRK
jgi:dTDP-4-amino-4,6-dideoxygalactose transaminase